MATAHEIRELIAQTTIGTHRRHVPWEVRDQSGATPSAVFFTGGASGPGVCKSGRDPVPHAGQATSSRRNCLDLDRICSTVGEWVRIYKQRTLKGEKEEDLKVEQSLNTKAAREDNVISHWYRILAYLYDPFVWVLLLFVGGEGAWRRRFCAFVDPKPGEHIFELCCGTGAVTWRLAKKTVDPTVKACDLSPDQIRVARWKAKIKGIDIDYTVQDASNTSYPSSFFNKVVLSDALHEIQQRRRIAIYKEAYRLLKPNGFFYLSEPNRSQNGWGRFCIDFIFANWNPERKTAWEIMDGLEREVSEAGFQVVEKRLSNLETVQNLKCTKR